MKKDGCPLTVSEWVQYLANEQNRERYDYYNEEVSFLSNMIIVLTIILGLFGFLSIFNAFNFVPDDYKVLLAVISGIVFIVIIIYSLSRGNYFNKQKKRMSSIIAQEGDIVESILDGKLKDTNEIHDRYKQIWNK